MGIAACQARFLGITARKSACEFKSTEIAQRKSQISEQLGAIAKDYGNAMNATKLIWDNEHCDQMYGLTFNIFMQPNAANDYNPRLLSTPLGSIILSGDYAKAAEYAGISKVGGHATEAGRNKFIQYLAGQEIKDQEGYVEESNAKEITRNTYLKIMQSSNTGDNIIQYNPKAGLGSVPLDKESVDVMDFGAMAASDTFENASLFKEVKTPLYTYDENGLEVLDVDEKTGEPKYKETKDTPDASIVDLIDLSTDLSSTGYKLIKGSTVVTDKTTVENMTLSDLASNDIYIFTNSGEAESMFNDVIVPILDRMALALGYDYDSGSHRLSEGTGLWVDDESKTALKKAYAMTKQKLKSSYRNPYGKESNNDRDRGGTSNNTGTNFAKKGDNAAYDNSNTYVGIAQNAGGSQTCLNLSNVLDMFLTYYAMAVDKDVNTAYCVGKSVENSNFVTDDMDYKYVLNDSPVKYTQGQKIADFYDQMYNNICLHGWRRDDAMLDEQYLEAALKDGRYSMMALNEDGWFYQLPYGKAQYMKEVKDESAIARAEAEYTQKKAELNAMEDRLDIKMKQIDAEIAELNTECESVKNLIQKNIDKSFQMFAN